MFHRLSQGGSRLRPGCFSSFIPRIVNKKSLIKKIIAHLADELELYLKAARASHAEATDPQSKAENKYDTRGLEAAYLARGQSRQAAQAEQAIQELQKLRLREFSAKDPIDLGALVELEGKGEHTFYFIAPRGGGTEIRHEKKEVLVITPQSPLGEQLVGKLEGEQLEIEIAGGRTRFAVVSVK
jgi:transcription elongation GreA/GreB family factor